MKKLILAGLLVAGVSLAADGKAIFQSKGCASCHQPAVDTVGPSLKKIAQAYTGKEEQLVKYLKGQAKPIVDPARASVVAQLILPRLLICSFKGFLADKK
ncbi:MAG TPA: c-type cytochrome, partial [Aquificaceae bacterium]|nr:c-type cytochrome [Aquificaceae bacterium]